MHAEFLPAGDTSGDFKIMLVKALGRQLEWIGSLVLNNQPCSPPFKLTSETVLSLPLYTHFPPLSSYPLMTVLLLPLKMWIFLGFSGQHRGELQALPASLAIQSFLKEVVLLDGSKEKVIRHLCSYPAESLQLTEGTRVNFFLALHFQGIFGYDSWNSGNSVIL